MHAMRPRRHADDCLAGRDVASLPNEEEEDLQPRQMGQRLERLDVLLTRVQAGKRQGLHVSKSIKR